MVLGGRSIRDLGAGVPVDLGAGMSVGIDGSSPAFPFERTRFFPSNSDQEKDLFQPGMTLRDYLVGQAITGLCSHWKFVADCSKDHSAIDIVTESERIADEYLRRRAERIHEPNQP